jgi:hypothetical protein
MAMHTETEENAVHGLMAEFDGPETLVEATQKAYNEGYRQMDAYSPFPVHGLNDALGFRWNMVPTITLIGGLTGAAGGFALQWFGSSQHYVYNVGGRPPVSWPMFIPITFECGILVAAFSALIGMIVLNGLPQPYHPVFNNERFVERAFRDGFFLCLESNDPRFDEGETRSFLEGLGAKSVTVVDA